MGQTVVSHRCQQHRPLQRLVQQLQAGVGLRQIGQRLGLQAQRVKSCAVVGQRQALVGSTFYMGPGMGFYMVACLRGVARQCVKPRRNA